MNLKTSSHAFHLPKRYKMLSLALDSFDNTPLSGLPPKPFLGTGVYALYYLGNHPVYEKLARHNKNLCDKPIYVGKAVARGWRMGRENGSEGNELVSRLREHSRSIAQTTGLKVKDFKCRFMILTGDEASLITSIEAALTRKHHPLWNSLIDGFGNHDPGSGRYDQAVSEWDALHPGRSWVAKLTGAKPSPEKIIDKTRQYLEKMDVIPKDIADLSESRDE